MHTDVESIIITQCWVAISICELVIGIVGNLTACIVISCSKSMRTLTDFYLLSLTLSDLMILITGIFKDIWEYYGGRSHWHLFGSGVDADDVFKWIFITSVHTSILIVTAYTVERYLAIYHPFLVQSMDGKSRAKKTIITIWMVAAVLAVPAVIISELQKQWKAKRLPKVMVDLLPYILSTYAAVCFVLPVLLITTMYVMIGIKLIKKSNEQQIIAFQADQVNKKTLMMFAIIILVFAISWIPYNIINLRWYFYFTNTLVDTLDGIWLVTYSLSAVLNPVIYVIMSKKFREACVDLLPKARKKISDRNTQTTEESLKIS